MLEKTLTLLHLKRLGGVVCFKEPRKPKGEKGLEDWTRVCGCICLLLTLMFNASLLFCSVAGERSWGYLCWHCR